MSIFAKKKHLGEILVDKKVISAEDLQEVLLAQKSSHMRLGEILIKRNLATEEDILFALSEHYGIPYQKDIQFHDDKQVLNRVPVYFLKKNQLVPFNVVKNIILVGISDPLNIHPFDDLKMMFPQYSFEPVLTTIEQIREIISEHFDTQGDSADEMLDDIENEELDLLNGPISETEDILDMANEAPIIRLVNKIITDAVEKRASDIHIEPYEKDVIVRYRIDGILYQVLTPAKKLQPAITSRIKIMASLNIAENRLPQDGRIQIKVGNKDIDIRVSVFPTHFGERIVLRLLNKTDINFDLASIGFNTQTLTKFNSVVSKPHGIILVTGPTGSGKSTTLYCVLSKMNKADVNILTVEDPIEYQLNGVGQMQVKPKIDLTFAAGLRSILRQDPDIIMVGEIRDVETAEIAIQAALTGHCVLSTLHTNDAASGVTRLLDMGIEPFLISSSVNAFLAQRLVRRICPHCKKTYKPTADELRDIGIKPAQLKGKKFFKGTGCEQCLNTGYSGRTGIYELLVVNNEIRKHIVNRTDASVIKESAMKAGMQTLFSHGLEKVFAGETTIEEVLRVSSL